MIWRGSLCPTIATHGALYPCPQVIAPLIHERDAYLAWALKRSKAVNGNARVVGVVSKWQGAGGWLALPAGVSHNGFWLCWWGGAAWP